MLLKRLGLLFAALQCCSLVIAATAIASSSNSAHEPYLREATNISLWTHNEWIRLLHYKRTPWSGAIKSDADYPAFFVSEEGDRSPKAELLASIEAYFNPSYKHIHAPHYEKKIETLPPEELSFACVFPERARFIQNTFSLPDRTKNCVRYQTWLKQLNTSSVTLVFASAYMGNPASTFGHTFLKLNSGSDPLLDYGVNYAASVQNGNGLDYAVLGIFGGFPGSYSLLPYHVKVQEYSQGESRDLWEYPLNLDKPEVHRLLGHLWELGLFAADYYFFRRNCSYEILTLLEYARPNIELSNNLFPWVIPGETIRLILHKAKLLADAPTLRPSATSRTLGRLAALSTSQNENLRYALKKNTATGLDAATLDTLTDYLSLAKNKDRDDLKREALILRSKIKTPHLPPPLPLTSDRPDMGHGISKLSLSQGIEQGQGLFTELDIRPSLHDLLANTSGYIDNLEIIIPRAKVRYYTRHNKQVLRLEQFEMARVAVLTPVGGLLGSSTWNGGFGIYTRRDIDCGLCTQGSADFGYGKSIRIFPGVVAFSYLDGVLQISGRYRRSFRLGAGATLGLLARYKRWSLEGRVLGRSLNLGEGRYGWNSHEETRYLEVHLQSNLSLTQNTELRLAASHQETSKYAQLIFGYYF